MRTSGVTSRGRRFVPDVECLEDRTVPDGNVTVALGAQVLYVTGDEAANRIWVQGFGKDSVIVRPLDATTTINGKSGPLFLSSVKEGYCISLNGGDDQLVVSDTLSRRGLTVDMGDGNDTLGVYNAAHRGPTVIKTGAGNDTIDLRLSVFRDFMAIDPGAGDDQISADLVRGKGLFMGNSQGTDYFNNQRTAFGRLEATGFLPGAPPPTAPDTTAPTVALASDTPAAISAGTIDYTATFSEDVSGFTAAGVDVANGSVTSFTQVDARTYRFSVTPAAQGTVTATVKAAAAFDAGGNVSTASNTVSRVFDTTAPTTPTFDLAPASDSGTVGDLRTDKTAVALTGTAEPGATVTLFRAVSGTAPGSQPVVATTTAGANGSFSFNVTLALGPNSYAIRATDAAGNSSSTFAQTFTLNSAPTATPISDQNLTVAGGAKTLDLLSFFSDAERVVRLSVTYPNGQSKFIDINLFPGAAPNTVANFLAYVNSANAAQNYNGTIFHRLVSGFVLQGGGYKFDDPNNTFTPTTKMAAVNNEPNVSNTRGTIAMAKTGGNPNSATSEFFFNLGDNSANLDVQNGGFTVFGQLMDSGQQTVDAISGLPTFSGTGAPGGGPTPISQGANTTSFPQNISASDLAVVTTAAELTAGQKMTFSVVGTSNSGVATASLNGSTLTINPIGPGTATITVRATDLDGSTTDVQIKVNVTA